MLEVTAILFIIGVILSMVIPNYVNRINNANYEKTVNELTAIAQASIDYLYFTGILAHGNKSIGPTIYGSSRYFQSFWNKLSDYLCQ